MARRRQLLKCVKLWRSDHCTRQHVTTAIERVPVKLRIHNINKITFYMEKMKELLNSSLYFHQKKSHLCNKSSQSECNGDGSDIVLVKLCDDDSFAKMLKF